MDNAAKALIIAGAILLSILLIAVGMFIFSNAQKTIQNSASKMSGHERNTFNQQFEDYAGEQQGSMVKNLVNIIQQNFAENKDNISMLPELKLNGISEDILKADYQGDAKAVDAKFNKANRAISSRGLYDVQVNKFSGLVGEINITRK